MPVVQMANRYFCLLDASIILCSIGGFTLMGSYMREKVLEIPCSLLYIQAYDIIFHYIQERSYEMYQIIGLYIKRRWIY